MFTNLVLNVACVFLMMIPGFLMRKKHWIDDTNIQVLIRLMLYFCYPCLIFSSITENYTLSSLTNSLSLPGGSALIMVTGYLTGRFYCLWRKSMSGELRRSFLLQCTINNYSFLPLAMIMTLFGNSLVAPLILSTLGAELMMWTLGAMTISGHGLSRRSLSALASPPLLAIYAALCILILFHVKGFDSKLLSQRGNWLFYVHTSLKNIGQGTVPLALAVAGARMAQLRLRDVHNKTVYMLCCLRLLVIPALAFGLLWLLPLSDNCMKVLTIVAVMPVSLNSLVLNELYGGNRQLIAGSVLLTHLLSIATIPILLYYFL